MKLTEAERYKKNTAALARDWYGINLEEEDVPIPDELNIKKICPVIQRPCIKEQCLAFIYSTHFNGDISMACSKCTLLGVIV